MPAAPLPRPVTSRMGDVPLGGLFLSHGDTEMRYLRAFIRCVKCGLPWGDKRCKCEFNY